MTPRSGRAWLAATAVSLLAAAAPLVADDTLVRRDGGRETGKLQACTHDRCQWAGRSVPRTEIAWIGLGQTGAPPSPADPSRDAVWLADGRTVAGLVAGVSLGVVAIEGQSFDRGEVSWVYFGSSAGPPPPAAEAPSAPSAAAPPPAARPGPPSGAPRAPPVPQPPRGVTPPPAPLPAPAAPQAPAPPPQPTATLLLNEIRFLPVEGEAQFVEIKNASAEKIALDGVSLRNEKGKAFELPKGLAIEPGAFLLVRLDGEKGTEAAVVHAPIRGFLGQESGSVWLRAKEGLVDGVAWGLPDLSSVDLCRGGRCSPPRPGSVLARLPDVARPLTPAAWAPLDPEHASPGQPNPRPPVSAFAVFPGMIFTGNPRFSWYSVPGASSYRVQVAAETEFTTILHEASVVSDLSGRLHQLTVPGPELPPGSYFWRVQAVGAGGEAAKFSAPVAFTVGARRAARRATRALPGGIDNSNAQAFGGGADGPPPADSPGPVDIAVCPGLALEEGEGVCKELAVPLLEHQKDTRMLVLEPLSEFNPGSWDTPDDSDAARYPYCARAAVAAINNYYRGKVTQDRIGYEAFQDLRTGPEWDLVVSGITDDRTSRLSLPFAIGTSGERFQMPYVASPVSLPFNRNGCMEFVGAELDRACAQRGWEPGSAECEQYRREHSTELDCPPEIAYAWGYEAIRNIKQEIDGRRPLMATEPGHLFLIVGYAQKGTKFFFMYQDEGGRQAVQARPKGLVESMESYWTGLAAVNVRSDEPVVAIDSDEDGVVDFDESRRRFKTDPRKPDSDDDGVEDKKEIRASVFDLEHGYLHGLPSVAGSIRGDVFESLARGTALRGRDLDRDGKMMELDPDSDNGGCKDGEEDLNANGIRDPGETSNFDPADDPTIEPGVCAPRWAGTVEMRLWTRNPNDRRDIHVVAQVLLSEINAEPIVDPGPAHGGRKAGVRLGSLVHLKCVNMTLHETWRDELRSESGGEVMVQVLTAEGSKTVEEFSPTAGFIWRKSGDLDLTPLLGFDLPRDGGNYAFSGCDFAFREDLQLLYTCSGSRSCYEPFTAYSQFTGPYGIGRAPTQPAIPCADPEVRQLEGGTRMTGSYSFTVGEGQCVTTNGHVSWNICRAGTPCDPPPPLPPVDGETEPGGVGAQRP